MSKRIVIFAFIALLFFVAFLDAKKDEKCKKKKDPFLERLAKYPAQKAIIERRSTRVGKGYNLPGGPLKYDSQEQVRPITESQTAALAFAASGITGLPLGELPYDFAGAGYVLNQFRSRSIASADSVHATGVFVTTDNGTYYLRRPQEVSKEEYLELIELAKDMKFEEHYKKLRKKVRYDRLPPVFQLPFNQWSSNLPGQAFFLPVTDLTSMYMNFILYSTSENYPSLLIDDQNDFKPAGLDEFAIGNGGFLGLFNVTIAELEQNVIEFAAGIETGSITQNLGIMAQAVGCGGWAHFANLPTYYDLLNFTKTPMTQKQGFTVEVPVGVDLPDGDMTYLRSWTPPYFANMTEAMWAFVDYKFNNISGTLKGSESLSNFKNQSGVFDGIFVPTRQNVEAAAAYAQYIWDTYGRFPRDMPPLRINIGYGAHNLDCAFYDIFHNEGALSEDLKDFTCPSTSDLCEGEDDDDEDDDDDDNNNDNDDDDDDDDDDDGNRGNDGSANAQSQVRSLASSIVSSFVLLVAVVLALLQFRNYAKRQK